MLQQGTTIQNRYVIKQLIGQGGMGAVYQALDQRFQTDVALKQKTLSTQETDQAFEREARLLNSMRHTALPRVIDYFADAHGQFLVMEYISGDDLHTMLTTHNRPFALQDVLHWADQALDALDYLHRQQPPVIHRDIKPRNLKLTTDGHIILLDFGIAKGGSQHTRSSGGSSVRFYTPEYAPIEQVQASGTTPRSDLYSLAATLYHLLTNTPPADAITRAAELASGNPDPLRPASEVNPAIPVAVSDVLMDALSTRADARPANAADMRAALRQASQQHGGRPAYEGTTIQVLSPQSPPPASSPSAAPNIHEAETVKVPAYQPQQHQQQQPPPTPHPTAPQPRPQHQQQPPPYAGSPTPAPPPQERYQSKSRTWVVPVVGIIFLLLLLVGISSIVSLLNKDTNDNNAGVGVVETPSLTTEATPTPMPMDNPTPTITPIPIVEATMVPVPEENPPPPENPAPPTAPPPPPAGGVIVPDAIGQLATVTEWQGHWGDVKGVAISPNGQTIASASGDDHIQLWSTSNNGDALLPPLAGHGDDVTGVAFSPNGQLIASCADDETVRIWQGSDGREVYTLEGHEEDVVGIAFSPDSLLVASASLDGTVRLWGAQDGGLRDVLSADGQEVFSVAFSPSGTTVAAGLGNGVIRIWTVGAGAAAYTDFVGHEKAVTTLSYSSDWSMLASGSKDKTIRLWQVSSASTIRSIPSDGGEVLSVAYSPDGQTIAAGLNDDTLRFWRAGDGTLLRTITDHRDDVTGVAFSAQGDTVVSSSEDDTVRVWQIQP